MNRYVSDVWDRLEEIIVEGIPYKFSVPIEIEVNNDLKYFVGNTIKIETLWHNLYGLANGKLIYIPNFVSSIQQWEIIENTIKKESGKHH